MNKSPAFQFYPDKWMADTRRLTWHARGIYHELLCIMWLQFQDTCSMPDDDDFIARELGARLSDWVRAKREIMHPERPLLQCRENRLFSDGLKKELLKQSERRNQLVENGKLGGRPKNQKVISEKANDKQTPVTDTASSFHSDNLNESLPSPTPTPTPTPSPTVVIGERERKLPEIPPISRKEFDTLAEMRGVPKECADWFWNTNDARNWVDNRGNSIRKVEPLLLNALASWRSKPIQAKPGTSTASAGISGAERVQSNQEYERVIERLRKVQDGAATNAMGEKFYTPQEKSELQVLRNRKRELKQILGIVA